MIAKYKEVKEHAEMIKGQQQDAESQLEKIKTEKVIASAKSREFSSAISREKTKIHWAID
jgi:hypothetical protein